MKFEKLTENKIRVIVNISDLEENNLDIHMLLKKENQGKNFFLDMIEKANKEIGFNTDGCKLLIEAFSGTEDNFIFTITKYSNINKNSDLESSKKIIAKRKNPKNPTKQAIYRFNNFDEYLDFCKSISIDTLFDIKYLSKNISLYLYNDYYYLILKNINTSYENSKTFYSLISEFSYPINYSNNFEYKLLEYGKLIIKKDAISIANKYFN